jgi:hypothetical protein
MRLSVTKRPPWGLVSLCSSPLSEIYTHKEVQFGTDDRRGCSLVTEVIGAIQGGEADDGELTTSFAGTSPAVFLQKVVRS